MLCRSGQWLLSHRSTQTCGRSVRVIASRLFSSDAPPDSHAEYFAKIQARAKKRGIFRLSGVKTDGTTPRFYKSAEAVPSPSGSGWEVAVDGRYITTPGDQLSIVVPTKALAVGIASEFQAQATHIRPVSMPLLHYSSIAVDQIGGITGMRKLVIDELITKWNFDNICFRDTDENQPEKQQVVVAQRRLWDPILLWVHERFGIQMPLITGFGDGLSISDEQQQKMREYLQQCNDWELAVLDGVSRISKSLCLSVALLEGRLSVDKVIEAARCTENWQAGKYGVVEGHHDRDEAFEAMHISACALLLELLKLPEERVS